jgi:hypothetical protein
VKRLEYRRRIRSVPGHARNAAEAVMYLAHVARERHRLEQEQNSLVKRISRIRARLARIAGAETKLVLPIHPGARPSEAPPLPPAAVERAPALPLPAGITQVTFTY